MAKKMRKRTRNLISGMLVGIASIFAVINFADIPADEVQGFLVSTLLFFVGIFLLALFAVSCFKLLGFIPKMLFGDDGQDEKKKPGAQDDSPPDPSEDSSRE